MFILSWIAKGFSIVAFVACAAMLMVERLEVGPEVLWVSLYLTLAGSLLGLLVTAMLMAIVWMFQIPRRRRTRMALRRLEEASQLVYPPRKVRTNSWSYPS